MTTFPFLSELKYRSPLGNSSSPVSKLSRLKRTPSQSTCYVKTSPQPTFLNTPNSDSTGIRLHEYENIFGDDCSNNSSAKPSKPVTEPYLTSPGVISRPVISALKHQTASTNHPSAATSTNAQNQTNTSNPCTATSTCAQNQTTKPDEKHSTHTSLTSPPQSAEKHSVPMTTPVRRPTTARGSTNQHIKSGEEIISKLDVSNLSQFTSSFFLTPRGGGGIGGTQQRQLYGTGLMSPYTSTTSETVRLGVPEEVFRLIHKIRGVLKI